MSACVRKRAGRTAVEILFYACARYMGRTRAEFFREIAISVVASVQQEAISDGLEALPLTERERSALRRLGFDPDLLKGLRDYKVECMLFKEVE